MLFPGSRYAPPVAFTPAPGVPVGLLRPRQIVTAAGAVEHTLAEGERMDLLSRHYYTEPRQWWLIVDANPDVVCAADLEASPAQGHVIQIPPNR